MSHAQGTDPNLADHADCESRLALLESANAVALLESALVCDQEGDEFHSSLFLVIGQIRGLTDVTLLQPLDREAEFEAAMVYSAILYQFGGPGHDMVYADPETAENLIDLIVTWEPTFGSDYSPGWDFARGDRQAFYGEVAQEQIAERVYQLRIHAALMADDHYRAMHEEEEQIWRDFGPTLHTGTEPHERYSELRTQMTALREEVIANLPPPPSSYSVLDDLPPEIDGDVRQLYSGINGPTDSGWQLIYSEREARDSWLSRAMSPEDLARVIDAVDFEDETLFVIGVGRQGNATGTILVQDLDYDPATGAWRHGVLVGVRRSDCEESSGNDGVVAYPFAIAIGPRPLEDLGDMSRSRSNFPDGCEPAVGSEPTSLNPEGGAGSAN